MGFPGFTLGIVAPYEIVAGNTDSLYYSLSDIAGIIALAVIAAIVIVAFILSLFRGRVFRVLATVCIPGGLCFWVQALFLNTGLPLMNGTSIDYWGDHATMMIVSALVWIAIFAIVIVGLVKRPGLTQGLSYVVAVALIVVQGVGVISLFADEQEESLFVTEDGLYEVSENGEDVIVFILDHFDTKFFDDVQEQYPEVLEELDGFTWYTDSSGMMLPTLFAVPYLLTGETPDVGEDIQDYYRNRYFDSSLISDLTSTGYSLGLYTSDIETGYFTTEEVQALFGDTTINVHELDELDISVWGTVKSLMRASLFRDMPWILKYPFGYYTDYLNQSVLNFDTATVDEDGNYVLSDPPKTQNHLDDVLPTKESASSRLTLTESTGDLNYFHLNGANLTFTMDVDGNRVEEDSVTQIEQAAGALLSWANILRK